MIIAQAASTTLYTIWQNFINAAAIGFGDLYLFGTLMLCVVGYGMFKQGADMNTVILMLAILAPVFALAGLLPMWVTWLVILGVGISLAYYFMTSM